MPELKFTKESWAEYLEWQSEDRRTLKRINQLLKGLIRGDEEMTGKPELLKYNLTGLRSLRIDSKNRIVYRIDSDVITIYQLKGHYDD